MAAPSRAEEAAALGLAWSGASAGSCVLRLLREVGPLAIWKAPERRLADWGLGPRAVEAFSKERSRFNAAEASAVLCDRGMRFVPFGSRLYPTELRHLEYPPAGLFLKGPSEAWRRLIETPRVTVVGTRKATPEGLRATEMFVRGFCARGIAVVSGLALGIDARAHRSALDEGGSTVAVVGCGADVVYPRGHRSLYERLDRSGVIASELPPGSSPTRWSFPRRNRLLAALGDAVLVIEGSNTSGALQTARWALDLGRPVFVVPGSIFRQGSEGCNTLLYEGAIPAIWPQVAVEDFLDETRNERGARLETEQGRPAPGEQCALPVMGTTGLASPRVLEALSAGPASVDRLVTLTGLTVREVSAALGHLEVGGVVRRGGPGIYLRAP
jgi:DNA processing protein